MADQSRYKEILLALSDANVEFLIVGSYAVMHYADPRFTKDLDIWVRTSVDNSFAIYTALAAFGAPLKADGIEMNTFIEQIGTPPIRVEKLILNRGKRFNIRS